MKLSLQQKKMIELYSLLSQDLGYIYGERESGPNGAKKDFLRKGTAFLRQLGKDLDFAETNVRANKAGIAVSGEVLLYGMWESSGIFFEITQSYAGKPEFLYRTIKNLNDHTGGHNQWFPAEIFREADYQRLCGAFLALRREGAPEHAA